MDLTFGVLWGYRNWLTVKYPGNKQGILCKLVPVLETPLDFPEQILDRGMSLMTFRKSYHMESVLRYSPNPTYRKLADLVEVPETDEETVEWITNVVLEAGTHVFLTGTPMPDLAFPQ